MENILNDDLIYEDVSEQLSINDYDELYKYLKNYYTNENLLDTNDNLLLPADKKFHIMSGSYSDIIYYDDILEYLNYEFNCDSDIITFYFE